MTINTVEAPHKRGTVSRLHSTPRGLDIHEWERAIVNLSFHCCSQVELNVNWQLRHVGAFINAFPLQ